MDHPVIRDSVGFQLIHASKKHRKLFTRRLDELGLQGGEELVLAQLAATDGVSQSEIAEALSVRPPSITRIVQGLEARGLIERRQSTTDSRVQEVHLTSRGEELIAPIEACWKDGEEVILEGFTQEERALLRRMLSQVRENATETLRRARE